MTRDQSIWSAARSRASSTSCSSSHTPAACQSRMRRQQVMPLPQPTSRGKRFQPDPSGERYGGYAAPALANWPR